MEKAATEFGTYIKSKREEQGKTLRGLAAEISISPAYLSDIENGYRRAPEKFLDRFVEALHIDTIEEKHKFYDMAGVSQNGQHKDINHYIDKRPNARIAMRTAIDKGLTDEDWRKLVELIKRGEI